jgi:hypothetical protein
MRCEYCHGLRWVSLGGWADIPCPECHGGVTHCCDGLCEQPEKDEQEPDAVPL